MCGFGTWNRSIVLLCTVVALSAPCWAQGGLFIRGDANGDGACDVADAQVIAEYLYLGGAAPSPLDAADANDDGVIDAADVACVADFANGAGTNPAAPFPGAGLDPTPDQLPHHIPIALQAKALELAFGEFDRLPRERWWDGMLPHAAQTVFVDLNGDGYRDLLLHGASEGIVEQLIFHPDGQNHEQSRFLTSGRDLGGDVDEILATDVDGDGVDEVVLVRQSGVLDVHAIETDGVSASAIQSLDAGHQLFDTAAASWGFAGIDPDLGSVSLWLRRPDGSYTSRTVSLPLANGEKAVFLAGQEHDGSGAGVLVLTNQNSVLHVDVHGVVLDMTVQFAAATVHGDLASAFSWSRRTVDFDSGATSGLLVRTFGKTMAGDFETATSHAHTFRWDAGVGAFVAEASVAIPASAIYPGPLDVNDDGLTDFAYATHSTGNPVHWSAHLATSQGLSATATGVGTMNSMLNSTLDDRIPMEHAPVSYYEFSQSGRAVEGPRFCVELPVLSGVPEQVALSSKICDLIDDMMDLADKLTANGMASEGTLLREIAQNLKSLKISGFLFIKDIGGAEGRTNIVTKAVFISDSFLSPDFDLSAACDPTKEEYWKLMGGLIHEGAHSRFCVRHPGAQFLAMRILSGLLLLPGTDPATAQQIRDRKASEKYYIILTNGFGREAVRCCNLPAPQIEPCLRDVIYRFLLLCGETLRPEDVMVGPAPPPWAPGFVRLAHGDLEFLISCVTTVCPTTGRMIYDMFMTWCGGNARTR